MSIVIDKQTRDLINRLNKADQDILKLKASINKILNKSTSLVATGSFGASESIPSSYDGLDTVAFHDNEAGEISALTEKTAIVDADMFVIEDSADSNSKKKMLSSTILSANEKLELEFFNGTFLEKMTGALSQSGTNVRLTIGASGGGDLTARFSSGYVTISDNSTIDLPQGTDTVPIYYTVYVLESTGVLTSGSVWPSAEHAKVCTVLAPTAAFVAANGAYHFQLHNDESKDTDDQGHLSHLTYRLRVQGAKYLSGIAGNGASDYLTIAASNVEFKSTAGVVSQMHPHSYGAKDTSTGTVVLMANDATTPYDDITDLFSITTLKDGSTAWGANKWIKLVFWGSANLSGTFSPIFCNKPSGQYNTQALAEADNSNFADYTIPAEFLGTGFLICVIVVQKSTTWGYGSTIDLRGFDALNAAGAGGAGRYTDGEAIAAVEGEATLVLDGILTIRDITDSNVTVFEFKPAISGGRTLAIGAAADPVTATHTGIFTVRTTAQFEVADADDANSTAFYVDTNNRIIYHGFDTDVYETRMEGRLVIHGSGTEDRSLQLPYLTAAPSTLVNGMMWMESDGLHIYYAGAEKVVAGV